MSWFRDIIGFEERNYLITIITQPIRFFSHAEIKITC